MAANDEDYALQLHKQLNAIPLRTRRGQDLIAQPSFDRSKQDPKRDKGGRPRTKRTNSSSQDHPSSKKKRPSDPDDDHGHTSAHTIRVVKREPSGAHNFVHSMVVAVLRPANPLLPNVMQSPLTVMTNRNTNNTEASISTSSA